MKQKKAFIVNIHSNFDLILLWCNESSGGVVLASEDGKIVCENTLDARLNVVFRQKLPKVKNVARRKSELEQETILIKE